MLGSVIKDQQPDVFNKVERLRKLGREVYNFNQFSIIINYFLLIKVA